MSPVYVSSGTCAGRSPEWVPKSRITRLNPIINAIDSSKRGLKNKFGSIQLFIFQKMSPFPPVFPQLLLASLLAARSQDHQETCVDGQMTRIVGKEDGLW